MFRSLAVMSAVLALAGEASAQCATGYSAQRGVYVQRTTGYGHAAFATAYSAPAYSTYQAVVPVATAVYVVPGTPTTALNLFQPVYVPPVAVAAVAPVVPVAPAAPTLPTPPAGYSYQLVPTTPQQQPTAPPPK